MAHDIKSEKGMLEDHQENLAVARSSGGRRAGTSGKGGGMRFLMRISGAIAVLASLALGGCVAETGDEAWSDEVLGEEDVGEAEQAITEAKVRVTCDSGWPGSRGCSKRIVSPKPIIPGSIVVDIVGHDGAIAFSAQQTEPRVIVFSASIHEGNMFKPGKNTTVFDIIWEHQ